ncbi:Kinesin motor domain [Carpediemonas membranifera]|uniref:Kinesin motor domain n=1 Tax=Carpediemonas membranifera TaxID=201153 RepID=A0A8J6B1Q3_9EUKA|nr:Kinesin motor domain [Carpediemonas membranifera]|eukprot:KAG9392404.1 Kinesin motor domain [Carpediemonas membranifera]
MSGVSCLLYGAANSPFLSVSPDNQVVFHTEDSDEQYQFDHILSVDSQSSFYQTAVYPVIKNISNGTSGAIFFAGIPDVPVDELILGDTAVSAPQGILRRAINQLLGAGINFEKSNPGVRVTVAVSAVVVSEQAVHDLLVPEASPLRISDSERGVVMNASTTRVKNDLQLTKVIERFNVVRELEASHTKLVDTHIIWTVSYKMENDTAQQETRLFLVQLARWTAASGLEAESKDAPTGFAAVTACIQGISRNKAGHSARNGRRAALEKQLVASPILPHLAGTSKPGAVPYHVPFRDSKLTLLIKDGLENLNVAFVVVSHNGATSGGAGMNVPRQIAAQIAEKRQFEQTRRTHALLRYACRLRTAWLSGAAQETSRPAPRSPGARSMPAQSPRPRTGQQGSFTQTSAPSSPIAQSAQTRALTPSRLTIQTGPGSPKPASPHPATVAMVNALTQSPVQSPKPQSKVQFRTEEEKAHLEAAKQFVRQTKSRLGQSSASRSENNSTAHQTYVVPLSQIPSMDYARIEEEAELRAQSAGTAQRRPQPPQPARPLMEVKSEDSVIHKKIDSLEMKVSDLDKIVSTGRSTQPDIAVDDTIDTLTRENIALRAKLADVEHHEAELEGVAEDLEAARKRICGLESELADATHAAEQEHAKATQASAVGAKLQDDIVALSEDLEAIKRSDANGREELQTLRLDKGMLETKLGKTEAELAEMVDKLAAKTTAETQLSKDVAGLTERLMEADTHNNHLAAANQDLQEQCEQLDNARLDLQHRLDDTSAELKRAQSAVSRLDETCKKLSGSNEALAEDRDQVEVNLAAETQLRQKLAAELEDVKSSLSRSNEEVRALTQAKDEVTRALQQQRGLAKDAASRVDVLEAALKKETRRAGKLDRLLTESKTDNEALMAETEALKAKVAELQEANGELDRANQGLQSRVQQLTRQGKDAADRATRSSRTIEELGQRVAQQQADLLDAARDIRRFRDTAEDLSTKLGAKEVALTNSKQRQRDLEQELELTRTERSALSRRVSETPRETGTQPYQESARATRWGQGQSTYVPRPLRVTDMGPSFKASETPLSSQYDPARRFYTDPSTQPYTQTAAPMTRRDLDSGKTAYYGQASTGAGLTSVNVVRTVSPGRREVQLTMSEPM